MDEMLKVVGGKPLRGEIKAQGSKNAALPVMAASLLLRDATLELDNVPNLKDISTMSDLLRVLGATVNFQGNRISIKIGDQLSSETPGALVQKMRASSLVLGPLLARQGRAVLPLPGGCSIGSRPIDLHLKGLVKMGATIDLVHGAVHATTKGLSGCRIYLDFPSVGATENLLMAAVLAKGETVLENAAREPEIVNLVDCLRSMGAEIDGEGTGVLRIKGRSELNDASVRIIPDRIAACTYLLAGVITDGNVTVNDVIPQHFDSLLAKLEEASVDIESKDGKVTVFPSRDKLKAISMKTLPYPGFPTDVQPQLMSVLCLAEGTSVIKESIFESRFLHASELKKMGANIELQGNTAIISGASKLNCADVVATDLRAGAALVLAGLATEGETVVHSMSHVDRGYECIEGVLSSLGAQVKRFEGED
ncbi:UDP-N-acetylglucosamine 1-carboxyvinyltransferase [Dethiosulfovibrio salsuginis]|uniref:UDP-N-acetylglucosamine 1-carboxyvinyltransferase n=1 Tax=Dethiosulfovibrio salsuginis TaxID=561720 RepID=A0A1X7I584_9BACT|nr:UDP-N-acetylglucosamine 1-carboxyvinyltransferase [Dethiosulfovibrio salsuginis]SMG09010.1 UDP-N-acetylglucosamine 1-carboxyvinyltransferase [Dethiosulfovibrio salsuginis]